MISDKDIEPQYVDLPFFNNEKNQNDEREVQLLLNLMTKNGNCYSFCVMSIFNGKKPFFIKGFI